jgi:hypothetical protein
MNDKSAFCFSGFPSQLSTRPNRRNQMLCHVDLQLDTILHYYMPAVALLPVLIHSVEDKCRETEQAPPPSFRSDGVIMQSRIIAEPDANGSSPCLPHRLGYHLLRHGIDRIVFTPGKVLVRHSSAT